MTFPVPPVHSTADEEQLQRLFFEGNDLWRERAALREDYGYQSITASLSLVVAALFIVLTVVPGFAGVTGALLQGDAVAQSDLLSVVRSR